MEATGRAEKAMAPHSSTLAWKIPWTKEPDGLQSMRSLRVRHDWATSLSLFTILHWRRKWQPTPVFLPGESQGQGSLVGCCLWGHTESNTTEATWKQQQQQGQGSLWRYRREQNGQYLCLQGLAGLRTTSISNFQHVCLKCRYPKRTDSECLWVGPKFQSLSFKAFVMHLEVWKSFL